MKWVHISSPNHAAGGAEPSSPNHPAFEDETDALLGNDDGDVPAEEEEEGEELFGDGFER